MPALMVINIKGGVAKTTTTVATAEFLAEAGKSVLVIDADHQCAASQVLLGDDQLARCELARTTLHDLLNDLLKLENFSYSSVERHLHPSRVADAFSKTARIDVIPGSLRLEDFRQNYSRAQASFRCPPEFRRYKNNRLKSLSKWLNARYDFVIIDCPPSVAIQVQMLLQVADAYVVPAVPDRLSIRGAQCLQDRLGRVGVRLPSLGLLWTLYRKQNEVHRRNIESVSSGGTLFAGMPLPFRTIIRNAVAISRAMEDESSSALPLNERYTRELAEDYRRLVAEICQRFAALNLPPKPQPKMAVV